MTDKWPYGRPRRVRCARCDASIKVPRLGRVPSYCGQGCKQAAHFERKFAAEDAKVAEAIAAAEAKAVEVLPQSPEAVEAMRALIKAEVWAALRKVGVALPADADKEGQP
jgi:hypothetical protein